MHDLVLPLLILGVLRSDAEQHGRHGTRILIVDDEPDLRLTLKMLMENTVEDAQVWTAADGFEALDLIKDQDIDLLITDFRMPHMDGLTLVMKSHERLPGLQTVMLSAFADPVLESRAREAGVVAFFAKPFDVDRLVDAIVGLTGAA